jgi:hypothetical protein
MTEEKRSQILVDQADEGDLELTVYALAAIFEALDAIAAKGSRTRSGRRTGAGMRSQVSCWPAGCSRRR